MLVGKNKRSKIIFLKLILISIGMLAFTTKADAVMANESRKNVPLIPRKIIFSNPEKTLPSLSPDGSKIAFLAPIKGVLNIWVALGNDLSKARVVTKEKKRDIRSYFWTKDSKYIIYSQDQNGDENFHLYRVDLLNDAIRDLTPFHKTQAQVVKCSQKIAQELLIGLNDRDSEWHDIYRLNIASGKLTLIEENNRFSNYIADEDLQLRIAEKSQDDGSVELFIKDEKGTWIPYEKVPFADTMTTSYLGFDKTGKIAYKLDSRKRDKAAFYTYDFTTGKKKLLAATAIADIDGILFHPSELIPQAWSYEYDKVKWNILDARIKKDFAYLKGAYPYDFVIVDRDLADKKWIVMYYSDNKPSRFYLYERDSKIDHPKKLTFLFTTIKALEKLPLASMQPIKIKSRDGLNLVCYLTLPKTVKIDAHGKPLQPVPMVLTVHGGPWSRDSWGLDAKTQWLANRGYAVLSVNYRGSTGFGKAFVNAGNRQWARKMHDDLIDAVNWTIKEKIADAQRIAIMGGSYGGYAALVGLTFTPDVFNCGISIVGPSNLVTLLRSIPPYWKPVKAAFKYRVGDIDSFAGRKLLRERSPSTYAQRIKKPLLILQGEHDPRVKKAEADQIVSSMKAKSIPVTYILYHDEGHGFVRQPNRISSYAIIEQFLAENLAGMAEPIKDDFKGANFSILEGKTLSN